MGTHMKTTIEVSDPLLEEARLVARREGATLRMLVEEGLRRVLEEHRRRRPFRLRDGSFKGRGLQPGVDEGDWERLRELAFEGRGG